MAVVIDVAGGCLVLRPLANTRDFIDSRTFCGRYINSWHQRHAPGASRDSWSGFSSGGTEENLFLFFKCFLFLFKLFVYVSV